MARVKLRCIMGCPGLKSSYREKVLLPVDFFFTSLNKKLLFQMKERTLEEVQNYEKQNKKVEQEKEKK